MHQTSTKPLSTVTTGRPFFRQMDSQLMVSYSSRALAASFHLVNSFVICHHPPSSQHSGVWTTSAETYHTAPLRISPFWVPPHVCEQLGFSDGQTSQSHFLNSDSSLSGKSVLDTTEGNSEYTTSVLYNTLTQSNDSWEAYRRDALPLLIESLRHTS